MCDESLTCHDLNLNSGGFGGSTLHSILCGESRLLISWCADDMCDITDSDEDHDRSKKPGVEDHEWSHRSGTRWPSDREVR
jgi:hypothetical protein